VSRLRRLLASHLGNPRGPLGRLVVRLLNRRNQNMNAKGVEAIGVREGDRALDLGFGGGVGLRALLAAGASHVTGAELSPDMVAGGRSAFADEIAAGRVELVEGSLPSLPFGDDAFDAIITANTIYFWPDTEAGMRELRRVLAPGGRLAIINGRKEDMQGPLFESFKTFSEEELAAAIRAGGFEDVSVTTDGKVVLGVAIESAGPGPSA
jgi:ubiquinone/menaquinone biosynthesis C-methylase UbiE